jgi:hypothetical protein
MTPIDIRPAIVFVSASAADACSFREALGSSRPLFVNVPDLTGARAVIEKLHPALVVCDTEIEGRGSWRDLLAENESRASFALVVISQRCDAELEAEVLRLGGTALLEKPFVPDALERIALSASLAVT